MKRAKLKDVPPYIPCSTCLSGWVEREDGSVVRCPCWKSWMMRAFVDRTSEGEKKR